MHAAEKMTAFELRATVALAAVFALRLFGMFSILPVLALHAQGVPGGASPFLVGVALGIDGLAQAFLQIPFGLLSDRYGRKRVIYAGLALFAAGSFIAASADDIYIIILGRLVQGTGAVAAAVMALTADLTREEHRAKAMAVIGMSIGVTFGASLVLGPALEHWIGVPGIFALTGVLAIGAMAVVKFVIPNPQASRVHADAETVPEQIGAVLRNTELQRLNFGIFSLHAAMRGLFVVIPLVLVSVGGMPSDTHWKVYLPVIAISFVAVIPAIIVAVEDRAGRQQGHGHRRLQQFPVLRAVPRRRPGRLSRRARQCASGVRFRRRAGRCLAAAGHLHAASARRAHPHVSRRRDERDARPPVILGPGPHRRRRRGGRDRDGGCGILESAAGQMG
ncbi:MAG: transporter [Proteobacteria bacterium]|nr:transporter [Pseudomonadota bacterium]